MVAGWLHSSELSLDPNDSEDSAPPNAEFARRLNKIRERVSSLDESVVTKTWDSTLPLVSVLITSYNHEDFISDALAGALAQKSSFPFEIIVRDDGSTDQTPEIVQDFACRFPRIIRPILLERNSGLRTRADQEIKQHAKGSFLALCDGDDFWIEEDKIQRQANVLMAKPDVVLVHHLSFTLMEESGVLGRMRPKPQFQRHFSAEELGFAPQLSKSTVLYRNLSIPRIDYSRDIAPSMDTMTFQLLSQWGGAYFVEDVLGSCKRVHSSNSLAKLPQLQKQIAHRLVRIFLGEINLGMERPTQARHLAFEGTIGVLVSLFRLKLASPFRVGFWALKYGIYTGLRRLLRVSK